MVLEYLTIVNLFLNDFFATHIVLISHMFAAVFLVLTEMTINMRVITPIIDGMEGMMLGNIPLLPSLITAFLFVIWATISIYIYQWLFEWVLKRYENQLTLLVIGIFLLVTLAINIKYRD
ncbi:MAG: hypothetical protein AABW88_02720 [Nanoarchaeota archaeon]